MPYQPALAVLLSVLLTALWIGNSAGAAEAAKVRNPNGIAVIIGNKTYTEGPGEVAFAHRDAEAFKRYVIDVLGFDPRYVRVRNDASFRDMRRELGTPGASGILHSLVERRQMLSHDGAAVSDVVVFYSGHGMPSLNLGEPGSYLPPVDADPHHPGRYGYSVEELYEVLAELSARSVRVFLDACFTGAGGDEQPIVRASPSAATRLPQEVSEVQLTSSQTRRAVEESARFEELLGRPFSPDEGEESVGWTDLHYAALLDLPGMVAVLIDTGVAVDVRVKDGMYFGDDRMGDALKNALAILGYWDKLEGWSVGGSTPLMIAARLDARDAAEALLAGGADIHAQDKWGNTPLHWAAWGDARETAEWLVANGAEIMARDNLGQTPLHDAAWKNARDAAEWLLEKGAKIEARNNNGETPLYRAALGNAQQTGEFLIGQGAEINAVDDYGNTLLHLAAQRNDYNAVAGLIQLGADIEATNNDGEALLHLVATKNEYELAKFLIERGANIKAKNNNGYTPLHLAAYSDAQDGGAATAR